MTEPGFHRLSALFALCLLPRFALAAAPNADPDWPCQQPLVPSVSAEMLWSGPPLDHVGDWHADSAVSALVAAITPTEVSADAGTAAIDQFLHSHPRHRQRSIQRAFIGLLEESNRERARVIDNIKMLAERQRGLADVISRLAAERDKAGKDVEPELVDRSNFAQRTYYSVQRTMRYACEMPGDLDRRLGLYAKALEAGLPAATNSAGPPG